MLVASKFTVNTSLQIPLLTSTFFFFVFLILCQNHAAQRRTTTTMRTSVPRVSEMTKQFKDVRKQMEENEELATLMRGMRGLNLR